MSQITAPTDAIGPYQSSPASTMAMAQSCIAAGLTPIGIRHRWTEQRTGRVVDKVPALKSWQTAETPTPEMAAQ